jgi:hypothetical protein
MRLKELRSGFNDDAVILWVVKARSRSGGRDYAAAKPRRKFNSVTTPVATLSMRATTSLTLLWDTANPFDNKTGGQ